MDEKRTNERINTKIHCNLFYGDTEYACEIVDMSEKGMGLLIDVDKIWLSAGDCVKIQFIDLDRVYNFEACIRYTEKQDAGYHVGCLVHSKALEKLVACKKCMDGFCIQYLR